MRNIPSYVKVLKELGGKMSKNGLPFFARGLVVKGFGRGSKELGIPTGYLYFVSVKLVH